MENSLKSINTLYDDKQIALKNGDLEEYHRIDNFISIWAKETAHKLGIEENNGVNWEKISLNEQNPNWDNVQTSENCPY